MSEGYAPELIDLEEASAEVRELLQDAARCLRSTWTPDLFLALAVWPRLLSQAWEGLRPNVLTNFFEESADRLRFKAAEDAAAVAAKELPGAPLPSEWRPGDELRRVVDGYHYIYPKTLLAACALGESLREAHFGVGPLGTDETAEIPPGPPEGMPVLAPPPEHELAPEARGLLSRIRLSLAAPHLPAIFLSLARWPEALADAWDFLSAARALNAYGPKVAELQEFARRQSHHLPYPLALNPEKLLGMGLEPPKVAAAIAYFERLLPEAIFLAAALAVIFRGHLAARGSPFPVPEARL